MPDLFPRMIYRDLEGDGDVSQESNQRTVGSEAELEAALKDGWFLTMDAAIADGKASPISKAVSRLRKMV